MAHHRAVREVRELGPHAQGVASLALLRLGAEDIRPAPDGGQPAGPEQSPHLVVAEPFEAQGSPVEDLGQVHGVSMH
jgi:hypothetical protein